MTDPAEQTQRTVLTVTELTAWIKRRLRDEGPVCVEGEVSKPFSASSGHLYLDLKDEENLIHCALWKGMRAQVPFAIEHGMQVVVVGVLDAYGPRSQYTLIVSRVEPVGRGALQLRFEQLKAKLQAEGLFDPARKRPLPFLPRAVGVVTSIESAARHDIEKTLLTRFPKMHVVFCDVRVQGEGAAAEIAAAIHRLNLSRPELEVLIVGRGGGSLEDLWAFNEEVVARAIASSRLPVISAVGHETDFTIADFAADVRAKTPTEAAHLAVPDLAELTARLGDLQERGTRALKARLLEGTRRAAESVRALEMARRRATEGARMRVERLEALLPRALRSRLERDRAAVASAARKLDPRALRTLLRDQGRLASQLGAGMAAAMAARVRQARDRTRAADGRLAALSPLSVLARGYSITREVPGGGVITDAGTLTPGQKIETILSRGRVISGVEETKSSDSRLTTHDS